MRRLTALISLSILVLTVNARAEVNPNKLTLFPGSVVDVPSCSVLNQNDESMSLEFILPSLQLQEYEIEGELYQSLAIAGGDLQGEDGQPGLPSFSRFVAVPEGARVSLKVTSREEKSFSDFRILPVQPVESENFVIDRAAYERALTLDQAPVALGEPAYMRHLRVVPLTFSPVSYDPANNRIRVVQRLELELEFDVEGERVSVPQRMIPESFDRLFQDTVIGYNREIGQEVGPGTYLVICPNSTAVTTRLQPLLDWRKRQGYNVKLATTAETGTTNGAIFNYIQNIYDTYDPPLEHVVLAGDANGTYTVPCWNENLSGYWGEGDHYYSMLEGGDILADVHIGRLSFRDTGTLEDIIDKIVNYEITPPTGDSDWFTRAGLAADRYSHSGITTVYVNQWLKTQLLSHGYTQIDTMWSANAGTMISSLNQGLSVFGYRGYLGMSGLTVSGILSLGNEFKLPLAIVVTCGTGSFEQDYTCPSEAFLRASNGGGIGAVGTATWGTHTRYNNCYYNGVWEGALNGSDHRLGSAHTRGKLNLYHNYQLSQPQRVEIWSMWNNLMGDPATDMWMAFPTDLIVAHPDELALGANSVPVRVETGAGFPIIGARVALYKEGEIRSVGYTDGSGSVNLPISGYTAGELLVTVTTHNGMPYLGSLDLGTQLVFVTADDFIVDDDESGGSDGNGNGVVNPGETIELSVLLRNLGSNSASDVTAFLSSHDPYVSVLDATDSFGNIPAGGTAWGADDFNFHVSPDAPDGHVLDLTLEASSGLGSWVSLIQIPVRSAAFAMENLSWGGSGDTLDPGEAGSLSIEVRNTGSADLGGAVAVLHCESPFVTVSDPFGAYGTILQNGTAENTSDSFELSVDADCFEGHQAQFVLTFFLGGGAEAGVEFSLPVGSTSSSDPTGPDTYGYYAFDNTDTAYEFAPVYEWVEIASNHGGPGTSLGLTDHGWEQDDTAVLDLPFTFPFYGRNYDQISVCSNGWAAMGTCYLVHYRNWSLPTPGSPDRLIAPFWDNLYESGSDEVYYWNDTDNHRFVIQWSRLRNDYNGTYENFELILFDPFYYPTATGDGEMLFQYAQISNVDSVNGYATAGIQNHDHTDGLLYTYWNSYTPGSATLTANRAIRILPVFADLEPSCEVQPEAVEQITFPDDITHSWLQISNDGELGSTLHYRIIATTPPPPLGGVPANQAGGADAGLLDRDFSDWLELSSYEGVLAAGGTDNIELIFDSSDLADGAYEALLVIAGEGIEPKQVPVTLIVDSTGTGVGETPAALSLGQNHPNPFNPSTRISFALPTSSDVRLAIYGVNGQCLRTLVDGALPAGMHQAHWDGRDDKGRDLAAGVYFYRLETREEILSRKMLLLK